MANTYECSDGTRITQATIDRRYSQSREEKYQGFSVTLRCQCGEQGNDNDHTIAQRRCKDIRKTELIWNPDNYVWSCRKCHHEWENFKSGEWLRHSNSAERLAFMREHDFEGYMIRITLTQAALEQRMDEEIEILRQQKDDDSTTGLPHQEEIGTDQRHIEPDLPTKPRIKFDLRNPTKGFLHGGETN